jgi:hypothetical protein
MLICIYVSIANIVKKKSGPVKGVMTLFTSIWLCVGIALWQLSTRRKRTPQMLSTLNACKVGQAKARD